MAPQSKKGKEGRPHPVAAAVDKLTQQVTNVGQVITQNLPGATQNLQDTNAYALMTADVGSFSTGFAGPGSQPGPSQVAQAAITDVLGWKPRADGLDPKKIPLVLAQSFDLVEEGDHIVWRWTPRTAYRAQTDLNGGVVGPQASLYFRGQEAVDDSLTRASQLIALRDDSVQEERDSLLANLRTLLASLLDELGLLGGPSIARVDQIFTLVLGPEVVPLTTEPDNVLGLLGTLRQEYGLRSTPLNLKGQVIEEGDLGNTVEADEQVTSFRILSDNLTSLRQSWINNRQFFLLNAAGALTSPFFGTSLVLVERSLAAIAAAVEKVRQVMNSVFLGPQDRQTALIVFVGFPPLTIENLLDQVYKFADKDGADLIKLGGKFAVQQSFVPIATQLSTFVVQAAQTTPTASPTLPPAYFTARVNRSLLELSTQFGALLQVAHPIRHQIPAQI